MNKRDESACYLINRNDQAMRSICPERVSEGITTIVKQERSEPETVGSNWSGQPGKDLFFNSWKLLF